MTRSLSDFQGFVKDAFFVVQQEQFAPEDITLGAYTFVPWVRSGIGATIAAPAAPAVRPVVTVDLPIQADGQADRIVTQTLTVRGPGDVIALDQRQIVRRYPAPGTVDAEGNFLAHVEFDRPDIPWLFSPRPPAGNRLDPWIALVVLRSSEAELRPAGGGLPPSVATTLGELQPLDDSWAWAHAQVAGRIADPQTVDVRLSPQFGPVNLSRLLCPRRLQDQTSYLACIVPTFEVGVKAALGQPGGSLDSAWMRAADGSDRDSGIVLPVFDSWRFRTGEKGDFESLAERLEPTPAPYNVGRRIVDVSRPRGGMDPLAPDAAGRLQVIRGPLVSPSESKPPEVPPDDATWAGPDTERLRERLNLPDKLAGDPGGLPAEERPIIGPEIYARHHVARSRLADDPYQATPEADWWGELNLLPVHRISAGLGTRVVRMDQEPLMQSAWAQVGAIDDANRKIRQAQLGRYAAASMHNALKKLPYGDLLGVTHRVQPRLRGDNGLTLHGEVAQSAVPLDAVGASFRRATRARGPVARYLARPEQQQALAGIVAADGTARDFQRPYQDLDGVTRLSDRAARLFDPALIARTLDLGAVEPEAAVTGLLARASALSGPSVPDVMVGALDKLLVDQQFNAADLAGRVTMQAIERVSPADPTADPAQAISQLALLRGLGDGSPVVRDAAAERVRTLTEALGSVEAADAAATAARDREAVLQQEAEAAASARAAAEQGALPGTIESARARERSAAAQLAAARQTVLERQSVVDTARAFHALVLGGGAPVADAGAAHPGAAAQGLDVVALQQRFAGHPALEQAVAAGQFPLAGGVGGVVHGGPLVGPLGPHGGPPIGPLGPHGGPAVGPLGPHGGPPIGPEGPHGGAPGAPPAEAVALTGPALRLRDQLVSAREVTPERAHAALVEVAGDLVTASMPSTPVRPQLAVGAGLIIEALEPGKTVTNRIVARFGAQLPSWLPPDWFDDGMVQPIMAAPIFTRPMYQALDAYDRDWLLAGLGTIKPPDFVTMLTTNAQFLESFLVGLSHEMARELLWRGYPTDMRGTYFRRFFDPFHDELAQEIHRFTSTALRSHMAATLDGRVVFLVRGELIRRYPDAIALTVRQETVDDADNHPTFSTTQAPLLFYAPLSPNIMLVGFDLTTAQIEEAARPQADGSPAAHPWWFVIAEHPTAPRFGLDISTDEQAGGALNPPATLVRDELAWGFLPHRLGDQPWDGFLNALGNATVSESAGGAATATWADHAGTVAHLLLQDPIRAAFAADDLIARAGGGH
jgi:hypothetical protein